ncbi:hypothetical protein L9F63_007726, partial [Diploptera punctata]
PVANNSPFSQTIKSKNEKRIFVPSTDRIRNLVQLALSSAEIRNLSSRVDELGTKNTSLFSLLLTVSYYSDRRIPVLNASAHTLTHGKVARFLHNASSLMCFKEG